MQTAATSPIAVVCAGWTCPLELHAQSWYRLRDEAHAPKRNASSTFSQEHASIYDRVVNRSTVQVTGEATRTLRPFQEEGLRLANDRVVRSNAWRAAQVKRHRNVYRTTRVGSTGARKVLRCFTSFRRDRQ